MRLEREQVIAVLGLTAMALVPPAAIWFGEPFYVSFFTRIMILSIAALSLGFILGFGGMSSLGHAVYVGIGAYTVAILSHYEVSNGLIHFGAAIAVSAAAALLIGSVSLRTSGIHFIMITLAFCQMVYFFFISLKVYGGDDGLNIAEPSRFAGLLDLGRPIILFYFVFCILALCVFLLDRVVKSRFGMVIRGISSNERRMSAIGYPTFRYRLVAFVIAGAICGLAGALVANQTLFVSPALMHWTRSGELLLIVIIGGMGTIFGPVIGAAAYLTFEYMLARSTVYWQGVLGICLILIVVFTRYGIISVLLVEGRRWRWPRMQKSREAHG